MQQPVLFLKITEKLLNSPEIISAASWVTASNPKSPVPRCVLPETMRRAGFEDTRERHPYIRDNQV
ncbi:MAG: hypothetical protein WCD79_22670 [Chthoniobacteraceae bacterium]